MSLTPQTKYCFKTWNAGSCESDTALKLLPALHVLPSRLPNICTQKISLFWERAASSAADNEVYQVISVVSLATRSSVTEPVRRGADCTEASDPPIKMRAERTEVASLIERIGVFIR